MLLNEISFPVYLVGKNKPNSEEGVLFFLGTKGIQILDDRNIGADTLGARRLLLNNAGEKLFRLHQAIFFIGDLIKSAKSGVWFIDNNGKLFQYTKRVKVPLVCRKIKKVIPITGGTLLEVEGMPSRFMCLYAPVEGQKYAALLKIGKGYLLYGFTKEWFKDTKRSI